MKLCLFFFGILVQLYTVQSYTAYNSNKLVNLGTSQQYTLNTQSDCVAYCNANATAVSYSKYLRTCVVSQCGSLQMSPDALWTTYACRQPAMTCASQSPNPMLAFWLTDLCGFENTGWQSTSALMSPIQTASGTTNIQQWSPSLTTATLNANIGSTFLFLGTQNYLSMVNLPQFTIDLSSNSLTSFVYIKLTTSSSSFPFLEISTLINSGNFQGVDYGPHWWLHDGGLYYNYENAGGCSGNCRRVLVYYTLPVNVWTPLALVYNVSSRLFSAYANGLLLGQSSAAYFTVAKSWNAAYIGGRPGLATNLAGSIYCVRVYKQALTQSQLKAVASSCATETMKN